MTTHTESKNADGLLLDGFRPASGEEWRALVEAELKGAPFEKRMFSSTYEGITLQPIYRSDDVRGLAHLNSKPGFPPFVRGCRAGGHAVRAWDVSQEIAAPDPAAFNVLARASLERGLTALNVVLDRATRNGADPDWAEAADIGAGGLSLASVDDARTALEGMDLREVPLFVRSGASGMPVAAVIAAVMRDRPGELAGLRGCIEVDPLGVLAHEGRLAQSLESAYREMAALTGWAAQRVPGLQTLCVHTRAWHEAGGNAVQELGFGLATAVEYLRAMQDRGLGVETVAPRLRFAFTVGTQFFMEIAKLRAARMLWCRVVSVLGGSESAQKASLHVRTSLFNKTVFDRHTNLLRTAVEAFAGVLAGCDSLQVGAFDEILGMPDEFSLRMARNQQLVLREECQLTRVIDPAGGSWYVERLTADLAERAWALFQEVEKRGGMAKALDSGWVQAEVASVAESRLSNVARRRDTLVGTNAYANVSEEPAPERTPDLAGFQRRRARQVAAARTSADEGQHRAVLGLLAKIVGASGTELFDACVEAAAAGATLGEVTRAVRIQDHPERGVTPVRLTRAAAGFETLRNAVEAVVRRGGKRPRVFLANLGPLKQHKARADFARGFFEMAGLEVVAPAGPDGFTTPDEAAAGILAAESAAVCICSTDETYPTFVPAMVRGVRAVRPDFPVILAGYPADQVDAHRAAGVDAFIHLRANALEVLTAIVRRMGVCL